MSRLLTSSVLFLVLTAPGLVAQSITASLEGIVRDPSGATVPEARVRVVNTNTNVAKEVTTNVDGFFIATLLQPGTYSITVEKQGFKQFQRDSIHLQVTQVAKLDVALEVGAITDSVRVTGETPLLDSATSSMGQVIDTHEIVNLPLNQRNPFSLILLAPGVHGIIGSTFNSSNWSANGGRPGSNEILLDGVPASPPVVNPIQGFSIFPSVDAVQEFKFQSNNYSAEFGRSGGSVINLIYKSGTNQLHGTMFEFLRNSVLDANDYFSNQAGIPLTSFKRNQFGASIGGPVYFPKIYDGHNKTFFFFAYEGLRERSAANPLRANLPTDRQKTGDFSQTFNAAGQQVVIFDPLTTTRQANGTFTRQPFAGNIIKPERIDPVAAAVTRYYPSPNTAGDPFTQARNFFGTSTTPNSINQVDMKVDQNISNNHRFFARVSRRKLLFGLVNYFPGDSLIAQGGNLQHQDSIGAAVNYTWTVAPTFLMDFRIGFSRMHLQFEPRSLGFNPTDLGLPSSIAAYADILQFPQFAPAGYQALGNGAFDFRRNSFETGSASWSNTKVLQRHILKFGFETRLQRVFNNETNQPVGGFSFGRDMTQGPNATTASQVAGDGFASFLLGLGSGNITKNNKNIATRSRYYAAYIADDWKVTPRLTLNLGFRYEVDTPRTENQDRMSRFDLNVASPLGPQVGLPNLKGGLLFVGVDGRSRQQLPADKNNFGPRFGFAYQISSRMVTRGAFGMFYAPSLMQAGGNVGNFGYRADTAYVGSVDGVTPNDYLKNPFPKGFTPITGNARGLLTGIGGAVSTTIGPSVNPYTLNWNYSIEYQLPGGILIETAYVGTRGLKLTEAVGDDFNLNQLNTSQLALGNALLTQVKNPFFGVIPTGPLSNATVPQSFLLRAFPQFTVVGDLFRIGSNSIYHSFQLKAEKRFKHGLSFLLAFTGAKQMDDHSAISNVGSDFFRQNIYDRRNDWSISPNDVSRRLVMSYVWELPIGRGRLIGKGWNRPMDWVLGGWQLNGIATIEKGKPLTLVSSNPSQSGNSAERPNNNGKSAKLEGDVGSRLDRYFDTSVFSVPLAFTFGNAPRTLPDVRTPTLHSLDASIFKNFKFLETRQVQLRAELFNATNTPLFGPPNGSVNARLFGTISNQANNPRQVQIALKILF
jgi:hypothetical protein